MPLGFSCKPTLSRTTSIHEARLGASGRTAMAIWSFCSPTRQSLSLIRAAGCRANNSRNSIPPPRPASSLSFSRASWRSREPAPLDLVHCTP